jgi:4-diphosphocytidyl-2-C-methyl-D-erythritol kinase
VTTATVSAKLTLSLRVLGRRPDGYHELEALTVSIGQPRDTLTVEPAAGPGITLTLHDAEPEVPNGSENLAARAAAAALDAARRPDAGVRLALRKGIPAGAGLGGGSADAAAALLAVRAALELPLDDAALYDLAAALGADVPFCLAGGTAWMRGRGERLEPLPPIVGLPLLVAVPPFRLATPAVYAAWDALGGPRAQRSVPAPGPAAPAAVFANDLEPAAEDVEPRLRGFRERLEAAAGSPALLAGSGSAYVVPVADATGLARLAARVEAEIDLPVTASATVGRGVKLAR